MVTDRMPPKAKATGGAKKRAPKNTHQLAPKVTEGTVLTDFIKKEWKVGKPIGSGGFGLIYLGMSPDSWYLVKFQSM